MKSKNHVNSKINNKKTKNWHSNKIAKYCKIIFKIMIAKPINILTKMLQIKIQFVIGKLLNQGSTI